MDELAKSWKKCMEDDSGGFLIPFEVKIKDREYERYRHLPVNWSISPITKDDLLMNSQIMQLKLLTCSEGKQLIWMLDV